MLEKTGDLWTYTPKDSSRVWRGIPTNGVVRNGKLIMGAGVAKDAKIIHPDLPEVFGHYVDSCGNIPAKVEICDLNHTDYIFSFPTKNHYNKPSELNLIIQSAAIVAGWAITNPFDHYILPRPGCGLGGLNWEDVKIPLLTLFPDNVIVVSQ